MNKTNQQNNDSWQLLMIIAPMATVALLYPILSVVYKLFSLQPNTMSLIGLFATFLSFIIGVVGLLKFKSISKTWRFLIFLLYFPIVLFSLLLSGF